MRFIKTNKLHLFFFEKISLDGNCFDYDFENLFVIGDVVPTDTDFDELIIRAEGKFVRIIRFDLRIVSKSDSISETPELHFASKVESVFPSVIVNPIAVKPFNRHSVNHIIYNTFHLFLQKF